MSGVPPRVDKPHSRDTCYLTLPRDTPLNYKRLKSGLKGDSPVTTKRIGTKMTLQRRLLGLG